MSELGIGRENNALKQKLEALEKNIDFASLQDTVNATMNNVGGLEDSIAGYEDIKDEIPDGPLFVSSRGSRLTARRVQQIIKQTGENATSRFKSTTPHTIRRTFGTKIARKYGLQFAQEQLGHESSATTSAHYAKMDIEQLKRLRDDNL